MIYELTLNSNTFNALKSDFDQVLKRTLYTLESKSGEQAEMTVKININLLKRILENGKEITVPSFEHKVASVMKLKTEMAGGLEGEYALVWDSDREVYVMVELESSQLKLFRRNIEEQPQELPIEYHEEQYAGEDEEREEPEQEDEFPEEQTPVEKRATALKRALSFIKPSNENVKESEAEVV